MTVSDRNDIEVPGYLIPACLGLSAVAVAFLFWLIYWQPGQSGFDASFLAPVNASLNAASALCLLAGYSAIRRQAFDRHRRFMLGALTFSALFLVSYVVYHTFHGDSKFLGTGAIRPLYFFILISHIVLSVVALPLVLVTAALSLTKRFSLHKRWARWTYPLWVYVSVTGVLVFLLLRFFGQPS